MVCGEISQNLLVLDFDEPELYNKFKYAIPGRLLRTFIVKTGKKGYHVYYRTPEPVKAIKMGKVDVQGEGKLAMIPPSIHPETGRHYEIENFQEPLKLNSEEVELILNTLKEITGSKTPEEQAKNEQLINKIVKIILPYWKKGERDLLETPFLGYLRKHGIPYNTAKIILEKIINLTGDEEASMRMNNLERNYYKIPPEKLEGYTGLKKYLQEQDLKLLEKYVKTLAGEDTPRNTPAGKKGKTTKEGGRKKEKIKKVPYIDLEDDLYLAVWDAKDNYKFAHLARNGEIELLDKVEIDGITYIPKDRKNNKGQELPVGYPSYDIVKAPDVDTNTLFEILKAFIWRYVDMREDDLEMSIFFILSTWFYRKANTTAYLRFLGDTGKGKSRMLKVIGNLCFYPIKVNGNATESAMKRIIEMFRGTLMLEESDLKGDKENEKIKLINTGYEKDNPALLTNKDSGDVESYDAFSPKLFAMRHPFNDAATEGRCLSIEPYETHRKDIPAVLPPKFEREVMVLRNTLARWTLKNWGKVKFENYEFIQNLPVEPRLKQMATPLSIILPLFQEEQGKIKNKFVEWLLKRQEEIIKHRRNSPEGLVFNAIVDLANGETEDLPEKYNDYLYDPLKDGSDYAYEESEENKGKPLVITTGMIAEITGLSAYRIKKILQELGFDVLREGMKIKDKWKTPHRIILKDVRRWTEAWERYRGFDNVGEIPEILKDEHVDYEKDGFMPDLSDLPDLDIQGHTDEDEITLNTLNNILKNRKKLLYQRNSDKSDMSPCRENFDKSGKSGMRYINPLAGDKKPSFLEFPGVVRRKMQVKARIRKGKLKPIRISHKLYTRVWAMEDFKVALPLCDAEYKKGDIIVLPQKVARILMKKGKVDLDWTSLFQKMEVIEISPEEFPEVGKITVKWESPCLSPA